MPRNERNRMSLNTVGFTPAVFNAIEYKPATADYSILERSLARQEERYNKAAEQATAVDIALGKVEDKLHNDPTTKAWFNDYKNNVKNKIQALVDAGDPGTAITTAIRLAGQIEPDSEIKNRIKANEEYKAKVDETRQRVIAGKVSPEDEEFWLHSNPFDATGETSYATLETPADSINWEQLYVLASEIVTPDKGRIANASNFDKNHKPTDTTTSRSKQWDKKDPDEITKVLKNMVSSKYKAVVQDFNSKNYQITKLQGEIQSLNEEINSLEENSTEREKKVQLVELKQAQLTELNQLMTGANNVPLSNDAKGWEIYVNRMINGLYSKELGYDYKYEDNSSEYKGDIPGKSPLIGTPSLNVDSYSGNKISKQSTPSGENEMPINATSWMQKANEIGSYAGNDFQTE